MMDWCVKDHFGSIITGGFSTKEEAKEWLSNFKKRAEVVEERD